MKDLYMRLGVFPNAGPGILSDAIEAHPNKAVQAAARTILLSSDKRVQYSVAHMQLKRIAQLRSNLGLHRTDLWTKCDVEDFDVAPRGHQSQLRALRNSVASSERHEPAPHRESRDWTSQD